MKDLILSVTRKDLKIDYYSGTGAGGQHRNKHQLCCRIHHPDSGALATCAEHKSKERNTKIAFERLVSGDKFKNWLRIASARAMMSTEEKRIEEQRINDWVDDQMKEENLKIEFI